MRSINLVWQRDHPQERDWIRFLLSNFAVNEIEDYQYRTLMDNAVVVMSSRMDVPRGYVEKIARTPRCVLYHISDESYHGRYADYLAFDFVFRNYWSAAFDVDKVKVLPLGYANGMAFERETRLASRRKHVWCFIGGLKASRPEAVKALAHSHQGFVHLYRSGGGSRKLIDRFGATDQPLDRSTYREILENTIFCPCPMGNVNLETWRLYEALEAGCIPIVESRLAMRYYDKLFPEFPVPQVRRWRQASRLIDRLLGDPSALQAKQSEIARWWQAEKIGLRAEVTRIVDQCFFGGTASTKMSRLVRPIAWLEMLRHQSPASATRRIALEWKKLVAGR